MLSKISNLIVAKCQNFNVQNILALGNRCFPKYIGYYIYGLLLVAVNILLMLDGNMKPDRRTPTPTVTKTEGQQPKTSRKVPVNHLKDHYERKIENVVSEYENRLQILKDENAGLLKTAKDKDEFVYKLTEDVGSLTKRVLDHSCRGAHHRPLADDKFLELLDDFVNDPTADDFPELSLLNDFKRRFIFEMVHAQKRKLGRAVREKEDLKGQLKQLECRQTAISKQEPREGHQELLQVVSTLKRHIETLEHEKREMGEILERQMVEQKRTDVEKESVIKNLMKKVNQLQKERMGNYMKKEESKSPVWEESRTDSGSSTHESEAVLDTPRTDGSSSTLESGGTVLKAPRMDGVSNDSEIESISNPSFWSAGSGERNGPDQILETSLVKTINQADAVKLPMEEQGAASRQPVSVPTLFRQKVEEFEDRIALHYKEDGNWKGITYRQYYQQVNSVAKAFIKLGLKRLHAVCMFGYNNPRWFVGHLAAIFAGGIAAGIYHTNGTDACEYIARDAKGHIFVVEGPKEVSIMKEVQERLNQKLVIIQYSGEPVDEDVYSWQDVLDIGEKELDEELKERLAQIAINQCCALVYTSGTSGVSKGVMLNHDNLTWESSEYADYLGSMHADHLGKKPMRALSYLSLAHVAALIVDLYGSMVYGGEVYFADRTITQGMNLVLTLQEVQPTFFLTIPRGWEKIYETLQREIDSAPWIKKQIVVLARKIGAKKSERKQAGNQKQPFGYSLADKLVFQKVKRKIGLQKCEAILSGASSLSVEISQFLHSLGITVLESYGLSESSGPHTCGIPNDFMIGASGAVREGFHAKIADPDDEGNGEILLNGRNIAMGYLNKEEETNEAIDDEGWLHTGDIGKIDTRNYLHVTGRKKRLIITSQGYNIAPEPIELKVKAKLPCVSFPVLLGDDRKFLSMLLPIAAEIDPVNGLPLANLAPDTIAWCRNIGSAANTIHDILEGPDERVMKAIQQAIDEVNAAAYNNQHWIRKWVILPLDFTINGQELTPTAKVRMNVVIEKYKHIIDDMYDV